jgi:type II secretory ATPase GspE/PulE/Tfp pilus assembly ATPase PilB-like protein
MLKDDLENNEGFYELSQFTIDEQSVQLLDYKFCIQNFVVILDIVDPGSSNPITIGMPDPKESQLIKQIEKILKRPIKPVRLNAYEIQKAIDIGYGYYEIHHEKLKLSLLPIQELSFDPDLSVAQRINEILGRAITLKASDVHIECYEGDVDVRFRIDGILHQINTSIHKDNIANIISRLKILSDLDISERRSAQDGRVYATYETNKKTRLIDFRLSILPGPFGEDAVLRVLDSEKPSIGLEELGFSEQILDQYQAMVKNPEGMILVTGPSGCGKTTTLYAGLQEVKSVRVKILTVEDPIEYIIPKVNQKQVGTRMNFADYARAFLRQDPDIMLIGEIRDDETADVALRAAQTGHLVLGTLHTNDSVGTISRLKVLGINHALLSDSLLCSLSQRLVRKVCQHCKVEEKQDRFSIEIFKRLGHSFSLFQGQGCDKCRRTGYYGRIGIFELFVNNQEIADMISADAPDYKIRQCARQQGMSSMFEDALSKIKEGITTFAELRRTVPYQMINEPLI